jgi:hypothetical protein
VLVHPQDAAVPDREHREERAAHRRAVLRLAGEGNLDEHAVLADVLGVLHRRPVVVGPRQEVVPAAGDALAALERGVEEQGLPLDLGVEQLEQLTPFGPQFVRLHGVGNRPRLAPVRVEGARDDVEAAPHELHVPR